MNPSLALVVFGIGAVIGLVVTKYLFPLFYVFGQRLQESSDKGVQTLLQFFNGFKEIILLGKHREFIDAYKFYTMQQKCMLIYLIEMLFLLILKKSSCVKMFNVGEGRYHTMVFTIGPGEVSQGGGNGEGGRGGKCWAGHNGGGVRAS